MRKGFERTSDRKDWGTPPALFAEISRRWGPFDLDVAAAPWNALAPRYFSDWTQSPRSRGCVQGGTSALREPWEGVFFCNPPYGRGVWDWLQHGWREVLIGRAPRGVYLLPARTDTKWFQWWALRPEAQVVLLAGRVTFVGAPAPAPFPSCLVVFDGPAVRGMSA